MTKQLDDRTPDRPRAPAPALPLVIDTDIGGDPDDVVALTIAALRVPELALVITSDESAGQRARFARHLLDLAGRPDVPVVAGRQLHAAPLFLMDGIVPADVPPPTNDVSAALDMVISAAAGPVRWLGIGPLSNLDDQLRSCPSMSTRLRVTQMGGALKYRRPDVAQHNVRCDVAAARSAIPKCVDPQLVISDTTSTDHIALSRDDKLVRTLAAASAPWAKLVVANLERWSMIHPCSRQHDPLALSVALGLPYIELSAEAVAFDDSGRMSTDPAGKPVQLSRAADYSAFMSWLRQSLTMHL